MKVFDCFLFYNELDLLEKRLSILNPVVDYFVIVEASLTFSGNHKPLFFNQNQGRFAPFSAKIVYHHIDNDWIHFKSIDHMTPHDASVSHKHHGKPLKSLHESCIREVYQRDSIFFPLSTLACPDDIVLLSDLDEIPNPNAVNELKNHFDVSTIYHFKQVWFTYGLNYIVPLDWFGTRAFSYCSLMGKSIDHFRYPTEDKNLQNGVIIENGGWHLSYLGGKDAIANKLNALAYQGMRSFIHSMFMKLIKILPFFSIDGFYDVLGRSRRFVLIDPLLYLPKTFTDDDTFLMKYTLSDKSLPR